MKKIISILLCAVICISSFSVTSFAFDGEIVYSPVIFTEKVGEVFINLFARIFNSADESKIEKAVVKEKSRQTADPGFKLESYETTLNAETWVMKELTFVSDKSYSDPFNDVTLDLVLTGNEYKYTVPGFWNGSNEWKIRFVCPSAGDWYFQTVCSDNTNAKLHNRTGKVICKAYDGELEIYKNGFVTTALGEKYFTYDNGVPFLYLGDTHWSLGDETVDMVKTICQKRKMQGFTVFQSEPIGAKFDFADGITEADMPGLADYDEKFRIIAENGLTHANSQLFYPYFMEVIIDRFGGFSDKYTEAVLNGKTVKLYEVSDSVKAYLEKISRYWVARYSAYPVFWTLGQEIDNDFYWAVDNHPGWAYANNPYKLVAEYIGKYDCYDHPLTAHQENSGSTAAYGSGFGATDKCKVYYKNADASVFRDVKAHSWYAVQWSPSKAKQFNTDVLKDYWFNSKGKPAVNYEGSYCGLWTKNFGSRMQGWCSYLSGLFGYGWGGHDTWSYTNVYDEDKDSSDGVDVITSQEKIDATWEDALEYESSYQSGYMLKFFKSIEWQTLIPRFNNKAYFVPDIKSCYAYASNKDNSKIVIYFYNFNDSSIAAKPNAGKFTGFATGTVGSLEKSQIYKFRWFNPVTGEFEKEGTFKSSLFGTHYIGEKSGTDMVLYIEKI